MARTTAEIANPILRLPSAAAIQALPDEARGALRAVLLDLRRESADKAQTEWKRNKGMTAAYWKAVSIYAGHISKLCRDSAATRADVEKKP
jgi:hypothetical protein